MTPGDRGSLENNASSSNTKRSNYHNNNHNNNNNTNNSEGQLPAYQDYESRHQTSGSYFPDFIDEVDIVDYDQSMVYASGRETESSAEDFSTHTAPFLRKDNPYYVGNI